ncbi:MAG: VOC family protein [Calditrichia bacterium]
MRRPILFVLLLSSGIFAQSLFQRLALDHINIAVADLETATALFNDSLGFAIKPGRLHENGINNAHLKFKNGTSIEIITASKPGDDLAAFYQKRISYAQGGSAAFLCLRLTYSAASDSLLKRFPLNKADLGYAELYSFSLADPRHPLFFIRYKKRTSDNPRYLYHWNGAQQLSAVWVSKRWWQRHFADFGKISETRHLMIDGKKHAVDVLPLAAGEIWLVDGEMPFSDALQSPLPGLTISVEDQKQTQQFLEKKLSGKRVGNPLWVTGTFFLFQE